MAQTVRNIHPVITRLRSFISVSCFFKDLRVDAKRCFAVITDAILDRIIHDSYQILVDGKVSMRERYGIRN